MVYRLDAAQCRNLEVSANREWLLANGIGGFAMGTAAGLNSRRYHGLLVAAVKPPADRMVLLANMELEVESGSLPISLSTNQYSGAIHPEGYQYLEEFAVGDHSARWKYRASNIALERVIRIHKGINAVTIEIRNTGTASLTVNLRPLVSHKPYHGNFRATETYPQWLRQHGHHTEVGHDGVTLYLTHPRAEAMPAVGWYYRFEHAREIARGLEPRDDLFCPVELRYVLAPGQSAVLVAADQPNIAALEEIPTEAEASSSLADSLVAAADKFFVETPSRTSILAGYPWFTDWGRDTMISLPGLCLHTGRLETAQRILRAYAGQMRHGLIPNRFVEKGEDPEYNTVDATLWFVNALHRTLEMAWDASLAADLWPKLEEWYKSHQEGTLYGIAVDPNDGLLSQGEAGVQLTWMDAKVGDWVVTPRRGKPVEINALWIHGLRCMAEIGDKLGKDTRAQRDAADLASSSFDRKFWKPSLGYYLDIVDPDDASLRPNQVLAMALKHCPMKPENALQALAVVSRELLTPVGLRTLAPSDPNYHGRFEGALPELDAAYHTGTVWPWLMGSYITALVRFAGDKVEAKKILRQGRMMLVEQGLGGIAEVYDGDPPRRPAGCPFQAWSVAEWLRAWIEDVGGK